jgi:hypothetical protein
MPDLSGIDLSDQCREVYAWAGLALYLAQVFEHRVVNLMYVVQRADGGLQAEFGNDDEFYDQHFVYDFVYGLRTSWLSPPFETSCAAGAPLHMKTDILEVASSRREDDQRYRGNSKILAKIGNRALLF